MARTEKARLVANKRKMGLQLGYYIILGLVLVVSASSFWHLWQLHLQIKGKLGQLNQEKTALLDQQQELKDEIAKLNTPSYIEQLAREQLGLVRHGEIMIAPKK